MTKSPEKEAQEHIQFLCWNKADSEPREDADHKHAIVDLTIEDNGWDARPQYGPLHKIVPVFVLRRHEAAHSQQAVVVGRGDERGDWVVAHDNSPRLADLKIRWS